MKYLGAATTQIPANSNLDNYTTPGEYYVASYSDSGTISGKPSNMPLGSFCMTVKQQGPTARYQSLRICPANGKVQLYSRIQYGSSLTWSEWYEISLTAPT